MAADIIPGPLGSVGSWLVEFKGQAFFVANSQDEGFAELHRAYGDLEIDSLTPTSDNGSQGSPSSTVPLLRGVYLALVALANLVAW